MLMQIDVGDLASLPQLCKAVEPTSGLILLVIEAADAWINKRFASKVWPTGIQKFTHGILMADLPSHSSAHARWPARPQSSSILPTTSPPLRRDE